MNIVDLYLRIAPQVIVVEIGSCLIWLWWIRRAI